ncbi:unnamed protein product [Parajaminaea phylloscopi]
MAGNAIGYGRSQQGPPADLSGGFGGYLPELSLVDRAEDTRASRGQQLQTHLASQQIPRKTAVRSDTGWPAKEMAFGSGHLSQGPPTPSHNGQHPQTSVPDIPGHPADPHAQAALREHVSNLTGTRGHRFPGAQPVSFTKASLNLLKSEDFWVCEKSDGQRVLVLVVLNGGTGLQEVFLIDRKNNYYRQNDVVFPHSDIQFYPKGSPTEKEAAYRRAAAAGVTYFEGWPLRKDTLLDGELVWDTDKTTGTRRLRLLLFDALVVDGINMSQRPLTKRYGRLYSMICRPLADLLRQNPVVASRMPFEIKVKHMDLAYGIEAVLQRMPQLEHGNDGLIFTCLHSGYTFATDEKIIKWKPPNENSIDFMLRLRFPPDPRVPGGNVPDMRAKPFFLLEENMGGDRYEPFDWAWVEDDEWEEMKRSGLQFDDRVVECVWDPHGGPPVASPGEGDLPAESRAPAWKIHRIRDDKRDGNHTSIVKKIMDSIVDGVEEHEVIAVAPEIRAAWKSEPRESLRQAFESGATSTMGQNGRPHLQHGSGLGGEDHSASSGGASSAAIGLRRPPPPMPVGPPGVYRL